MKKRDSFTNQVNVLSALSGTGADMCFDVQWLLIMWLYEPTQAIISVLPMTKQGLRLNVF